MPRIAVLTVAGAVGVGAVGCGGSDSQGTSPQILSFDGPSSVVCITAGQTTPLTFKYRAQDATVINASLDGRRLGFPRRIYDPESGTITFRYVCPGPHVLTIDARDADNRSATASIEFDKRNRATA